jgi:hypothetical protein
MGRLLLFGCLWGVVSYVAGALAGGLLTSVLSSNTHDKSMEAVMTGALARPRSRFVLAAALAGPATSASPPRPLKTVPRGDFERSRCRGVGPVHCHRRPVRPSPGIRAALLLLGHFRRITFRLTLRPRGVGGLGREGEERVGAAELYDWRVEQRVFIVDRPWLWTLLNGPYRQAIARNVELSDAILIPRLDIAAREIVHFDGRRAGAVNVLAHEAVHTLVRRRIGRLRLWRLQWWQKEGYAEYIASAAASESEAPARYRDAALAWKYLLEQRRLSFDQVLTLDDSLSGVLRRRR